MTTELFFDELCATRQPLLGQTTGTLRFDIHDDDHLEYLLLDINKGQVVATRSETEAEAQAVARIERRLFDAIVSGRANAMAAVLRGEIGMEGRVELLLVFQRLFPGPDDARAKEMSA